MRPFTANRGEQSEAKPLPNGIYYVKQQERDWDGELDVFGVLRLRADGDTLWHGQLRVHFLGKVLLHVYKEKTGREEEATQGPGVPTWEVADKAWEIVKPLSQRAFEWFQKRTNGKGVAIRLGTRFSISMTRWLNCRPTEAILRE